MKRLALAFALVTAALVLFSLARRVDSEPSGLLATHFANPDFLRPPSAAAVDPRPSTGSLIAAWSGAPPPAFSATWVGWIYIPRDGTYTFATVSDDGSWLHVDGEIVVDNGARHLAELRSGTRPLTRGMHWVSIRYFQAGGPLHLEWLWAEGDDELRPVPAWLLRPTKVRAATIVWARRLDVVLQALRWVWAATAFVVLGAVVRPLAQRLLTVLRNDRAGRGLAWLVGASLLLNLVGISWGIPSARGWAPDEVLPPAVLGGIAARFSGGWSDTYPVFHFYMLTLAYLPVFVLEWARGAAFDSAARHAVLALVGRLASVVMAAGTVLAVYLCSVPLFGRRAALFGAAIMALTTPFVFYAKTANVDVPYLFWFAASLVFYVRLLRDLRLQDFAVFAVTATLAICTKDQAYGLYVLTPVPIFVELWRAGRPRPLLRVLVDRRITLSVIAAAVTFAVANNLVFNTPGFLAHLQHIINHSTYPPMFDGTVGGHMALATLALRFAAESLGWPACVACAAGVGLAFARPSLRRPAVWLLVPVLSYYVAFLGVIRYSFDRFLLPVCLVLAMFGGLALARLAGKGRFHAVRLAAVALIFGYTALYTVTLDVMMVRDSRYQAERWIEANLSAGDRVGTLDENYIPRIPRERHVLITTRGELASERPRLIAVNTDVSRLRPASTTERQLVAALDGGEFDYDRVFAYRARVPWAWLPGMHPSLVGNRDAPALSNLRHVNPTIEIFRRREPRAPSLEKSD